jgi:4-hydroxy-tetrahydrodipicolinate synthase
MAGEHPARFGGVITAMVTPFAPDGSLDLDAAAGFARWLVDHGSEGLVVAGTTGESPVLSDEEKLDLWRAVAEAVTVPVIAGSTTNDTAHSVALTRRAAAVGVDAVLAVTPYYSRPSQEGLRRHFEAVAGSSDLPVVLYDIPVRTGRRIAPDLIVRLAHEVPTIVAVKDATGDPAGSARLLTRTPGGFELYSGDDALTLPLLSVGGVGVISVAANWAGLAMHEVVARYQKGDVAGARLANARMVESYAFESTEEYPNPLPAKAACRALGLPVGECRDPLGPGGPELDRRAAEVLAGLGATVG